MLECLSGATLVVLIAYRPTASLFDPLDFQVSCFYERISYSFALLHLLGISFAALALPASGTLSSPTLSSRLPHSLP
jgi:hypothetical protein